MAEARREARFPDSQSSAVTTGPANHAVHWLYVLLTEDGLALALTLEYIPYPQNVTNVEP